RLAKDADVAVLVEPAHLAVVGDVAPNEGAALCVPGAAFGPAKAGGQSLDGAVADLVFLESLVEHGDVRVRVAVWRCAWAVAVSVGGGRYPGRSRGCQKRAAIDGDLLLHGVGSFAGCAGRLFAPLSVSRSPVDR